MNRKMDKPISIPVRTPIKTKTAGSSANIRREMPKKRRDLTMHSGTLTYI